MFWKKGDKIHVVRSLNNATALATCGVPWVIDKLIDDHTGQLRYEWHFGPRGIPQDGEVAPLNLSTGLLLEAIRTRAIFRTDPGHPLVHCLIGLDSREKNLSYQNRGYRYQIAADLSGWAVLTEGQDLMAARLGTAGFDCIRTDSLPLVCALNRVGVPTVDIQGTSPNHIYTLPRHGYPVPHEAPISNLQSQILNPTAPVEKKPVDALTLARVIQDGTLNKTHPGHPALWVLMALRNREAFLDRINRDRATILIRDPQSTGWLDHYRSSLVLEGSKKDAFDQALDFVRS